MTNNIKLQQLVDEKITMLAKHIVALVKLQEMDFEKAVLVVYEKTNFRGSNWESAKQKAADILKN